MRTGVYETQLSMDAAMERAGAWTERARDYIATAEPGAFITADDIRYAVGDPPAHGDAMGAVFRAERKAGHILAIGYAVSSRPERHGAVNRTWRRL